MYIHMYRCLHVRCVSLRKPIFACMCAHVLVGLCRGEGAYMRVCSVVYTQKQVSALIETQGHSSQYGHVYVGMYIGMCMTNIDVSTATMRSTHELVSICSIRACMFDCLWHLGACV
jgi:hypothetical protein